MTRTTRLPTRSALRPQNGATNKFTTDDALTIKPLASSEIPSSLAVAGKTAANAEFPIPMQVTQPTAVRRELRRFRASPTSGRSLIPLLVIEFYPTIPESETFPISRIPEAVLPSECHRQTTNGTIDYARKADRPI